LQTAHTSQLSWSLHLVFKTSLNLDDKTSNLES
jgi:hypothetical protein